MKLSRVLHFILVQGERERERCLDHNRELISEHEMSLWNKAMGRLFHK